MKKSKISKSVLALSLSLLLMSAVPAQAKIFKAISAVPVMIGGAFVTMEALVALKNSFGIDPTYKGNYLDFGRIESVQSWTKRALICCVGLAGFKATYEGTKQLGQELFGDTDNDEERYYS